MQATKTVAEQILEFFDARDPCRIIVMLRLQKQVRELWQDMLRLSLQPQYVNKFRFSHLKVTKVGNDPASYIAGFSASQGSLAPLMGHYVARTEDRRSGTLAVIDDPSHRDIVSTWAGSIIEL